jgi:hypothetical protein
MAPLLNLQACLIYLQNSQGMTVFERAISQMNHKIETCPTRRARLSPLSNELRSCPPSNRVVESDPQQTFAPLFGCKAQQAQSSSKFAEAYLRPQPST